MVPFVSDKGREEKPDLYWMGVRDALRIVDSFVKWSKKHPKKAKTLEQFIADGLIAAAKRCENCLTRALGITYADKGELGHPGEEAHPEEVGFADDSLPEIDESLPDISARQPEDEFERSFPIEPEEMTAPLESEEFEELPEFEESATEAPLVPEMPISDDLTFEGKKRDFDEDFELAEPTPFMVESEKIETEPEVKIAPPDLSLPDEYLETETESKMLEALESLGEFSPDEELTAEPEVEPVVLTPATEETEIELETEPSFTWKEYERTLTPSDVPDKMIPTPPKPEVWSPYDEPSIDEEEELEEEDLAFDESVDLTGEESLEDETDSVQPPPPPPPPESDESEEERRRRARRLFFGD